MGKKKLIVPRYSYPRDPEDDGSQRKINSKTVRNIKLLQIQGFNATRNILLKGSNLSGLDVESLLWGSFKKEFCKTLIRKELLRIVQFK
jgi:hypothetical protein